MLPKERVIATLEHREPDRIPWGEHFIDYNVYEEFLGRETYVHAKLKETLAYQESRRDEVVASYQRDIPDLIRVLDMDIVAVHPCPPEDYRPERFERLDEDTYRDSSGRLYRVSSVTRDLMPLQVNTAWRTEATLEDLQDEIDRLKEAPPLDPEDSIWDVARHVVRELGATHFVAVLINGLEWPRFGATEEESWMNLVLHPDICTKIAELQGIQMVREARVVARLGADAIFAVGDHGTSSGLAASPRLYRDLCYPWQKAQADEARRLGLKVLRHCCGHVWPIIDELAEVNDAYQAIQPTAGMDIKDLKARVGNRLCLWGGIWHEHIIAGTPADIRADARYAFAHAGPGGGYIMGSSHSLSVGARRENILEMKRCRDEWGVYPLEPRLWHENSGAH